MPYLDRYTAKAPVTNGAAIDVPEAMPYDPRVFEELMRYPGADRVVNSDTLENSVALFIDVYVAATLTASEIQAGDDIPRE